MTEENVGKIIRHEDGKLEISGSPDYCINAYKGIEEYKESIKNKSKAMDNTSFTKGQKGFMEALSEEDQEIVKAVKDFHNQNKEYPSPTQVLSFLSENRKSVNYVTRKIEDKPPKTALKKCLEFFGGTHKGKKIRFTTKFQEL